jgi:hypothetical protein
VASAVSLLFAARAEAYRPFDGTDADVAEPGVFELEVGPAHYYRRGTQNFLITPDLVMNFGLFKDTELVLEADEYVALGKLHAGVPHVSLLGDDVLLKHTFRDGTLQGKTGISIAAEAGVLVPEVEGVEGVGGSLDVIASYRWSWGTFHWNEWFELTRDHHADLFTGVILEGPQGWTLRPVAELFYDKDFAAGQTESALVGAIWTVAETLSFDAGVRGARADGVYVAEARLGLTLSLPLVRHAVEGEPHEETRGVRPRG